MTTLAGLRNKILSDVNRTDLTAVAETAIKDAVKHYENERWWFNEKRAHIEVDPDTERVALPSDYLECDSMTINISSNVYRIHSIGKIEMDNLYNPSTKGAPEYYCLYDQQIRLFPIPDVTYTLSMSYQFTLPELATSDSTVWTNEMGELIRYHSQADIYANTLHNFERAQIAKAMEQTIYSGLEKRNQKFNSDAPLKSWL